MIGNILTKIIVWFLKNSNLSIENRIVLTSAITKELKAFPTSELFTFKEDGTILVNGRSLNVEASRKFREDAIFLKNSTLRKIVKEAVLFKAITMSVHNGDTPEKVYFGRSAIWNHQQEEDFYQLLANDEED